MTAEIKSGTKESEIILTASAKMDLLIEQQKLNREAVDSLLQEARSITTISPNRNIIQQMQRGMSKPNESSRGQIFPPPQQSSSENFSSQTQQQNTGKKKEYWDPIKNKNISFN